MDFDDLLEAFGDFGTYQRMVVCLVLLPAVLPCGFHAYNQIFMSAKPDFRCRVPDVDLSKNLSFPSEDDPKLRERCSYQWNGSEVPCREGWIYDASKYDSTVVTEWNLVCDDDFHPTLALVLFGVGGAVGNYFFGRVQDSLGRKISFFLYLLIATTFGAASAFATNFPEWAMLRFGVGFTVPAILESPYILAIELVGPEKRAFCTILINVAYSLGLIVLSGVCYLVRDWRRLTLATTLPFVYLFSYWWVMPESPRWLFAKGRFDECAEILSKIAVTNGIELPENQIEEFRKKYSEKTPAKEEGPRYGLTDLFRFPNMRKKTIIITLIWFTNTAVYVGLSYYAPSLGSDEFLNFFLAGIVELPTYTFLWPAMEKLGRRWTLCSSMVAGGLSCLATFLVQGRENVTLALYCIGKMGISSSFVVLPLMASELYPTVVRGTGISFSAVVGQIGPVFIPLVNYMGENWMVLPLMVMGVLLVVGGILSLKLPETLHRRLPQTLQEAERFGKTSSEFSRSARKVQKASIDGITSKKKRNLHKLQVEEYPTNSPSVTNDQMSTVVPP